MIDDQWGAAGSTTIAELYGNLPYDFALEDARDDDQCFTVDAALRRVRAMGSSLAVVLLDVLFGRDVAPLGLDILRSLRSEFPLLPVLMLTSVGRSQDNADIVVTCMEEGANEYVEKAPDPETMNAILDIYADPELDLALYGNSEAIRLVRAQIARVAFSGDTSVLIAGESGSGKELVAQALHRQGLRSHGRFVAKNCAYSDSGLLDSELFGHEKGAFTGALERRLGLIEEAHGGVLFLDEISDMPPDLQGKLLRVLETRTFRRVGGREELHSDFQLICATNHDPQALVQAGQLRQDLYYRISTMTLNTPSLREHPGDIPIYLELFLKKFRYRGGGSYPGRRFSESAIRALQGYSWPGNVREVRNVVERSVILSRSSTMDLGLLPPEIIGAEDRASIGDGSWQGGPELLSENTLQWPRQRLVAELKLCIEAKERIVQYKGRHWKAEFMRLMYPACKAANAKGFDDLVRRMTKGPWGDPKLEGDEELSALLRELVHD